MIRIPMKVINESRIDLTDIFAIDIDFIALSVERVNTKFRQLKMATEKMDLNIFEVIDFRMLSGLVGEALVTDLSDNHKKLAKNPNIDGYPDLLNASEPSYRKDIERWKTSDLAMFIKYPHGGLEIKNTFGTKKSKKILAKGQTRIAGINNKLDWKAHHRYTNNLLALFSDFVDSCPQIVAIMFSDSLEEADWKEKQDPKKNSTMTSFSVIERSGWEKLRGGIRLCYDDNRYLSFFNLEASE